MDYTFYLRQTDLHRKTVCRRGERQSRERPHQDVRAGLSSAAGRAAQKGGTRAYMDVFMACLLTEIGLLHDWDF